MEEIKQTFLYIKRHKLTGLLYFGKTSRSEKYLLESYVGSGKYWNSHLKVHGKEHVETVWYCLFTDRDELEKFALMCSDQWDIVKSNRNGKKVWANEKPENGTTGGAWNKGIPQTAIHRAKSAVAGLGRKDSIEVRMKRAKSNIGKHSAPKGPQTIEHREKISEALIGKNKGRKQSAEHIAKNKAAHPAGVERIKLTCPHCGKTGGDGAMSRWHFSNCRINNGH